AWWLARVRRQLAWFDLLRIDHFRGLAATWEIPAAHATAEHGRWVEVPGDALLARLAAAFGELPFIAEDLGTITPDVIALRERWQLPGMNVLQFAFDSDAANPYLPHNHRRHALVCTGTHDNDTTLGWFGSLDAARRARVLDYLGQPGEAMPWPLIRAALASVAALAVVPLQDLLGLAGDARMNVPGTCTGNWRWQCAADALDDALAARCAALNSAYGRSVTAT
ncbi:MAG: 4-alpha-glucanotransferase, partial [Gammaproteobacteria bacterium]